MEVFIPSLLVIVLAGAICFFIFPKMAPYTLGSMAVLLFVVGLYQHYQTFPYEYSGSRFREIVKDYSPFVMLLVTIMGLVVGVMVAYGGNPPDIAASLPALPTMPNIPAMVNIPMTLPNLAGNILGGNNSTAKNNTLNLLGGNVKRNNVASNSFKIT
jgi:hypothetical protein